jgi:hypothetical protein
VLHPQQPCRRRPPRAAQQQSTRKALRSQRDAERGARLHPLVRRARDCGLQACLRVAASRINAAGRRRRVKLILRAPKLK